MKSKQINKRIKKTQGGRPSPNRGANPRIINYSLIYLINQLDMKKKKQFVIREFSPTGSVGSGKIRTEEEAAL